MKKRRTKPLPVILALLMILGITLIIKLPKQKEKQIKENYLAGTTPQIELYDEEFNKIAELPRGTKVMIEDTIQNEEQKYIKIKNISVVKNVTCSRQLINIGEKSRWHQMKKRYLYVR